eukprot:tig00020912_g15859.t1
MDVPVSRAAAALVLATFAARRGYKKRSLDLSGAVGAFIVGLVSFVASVRFGVALLAFFFSASKATRVGAERKKKLDAEYKEGGQRNWVQVLANSFAATAASLAYLYVTGGRDSPLLEFGPGANPLPSLLALAVLGHYACCCGDTYSSELGILSRGSPRLVTTWRRVPPGTNGGVTVAGTLAAAGGGLIVGVSFYLAAIFSCAAGADCSAAAAAVQWQVPLLGLAGGLLGSFIDSLLGATFQYSGWDEKAGRVVNSPAHATKRLCGYNILDNHQVNFVSSVLTCGLIARIGAHVL